ncbi:glycosyltransferase family 8 protein [Oenococcus sp. UCMA 16435]|nr:glycosyltransferase family 8 protein [Oenococcus sp. UCMA 16435]MDI4584630.1 glycosyltransferase family 8 protein [Oenococcus sp. UCMA 14587]
MNLLYCGDAQVKDGVLLSVISLLEQTNEPLNIYIFTARLRVDGTQFEPFSNSYVIKLRDLVKKHNPQSSVRLVDMTTAMTKLPPTANLASRFTPYCMLRLYSDLVPGMPNRLLYLDADVLCCQDPLHFYNQDLTGTEYVGVLDHYGQWFFHHSLHLRDYINSGVLLLNLTMIRTTGLFARCRQRCLTTHMFMPDQSAINKLSHTKRIAPRKFNDQHGPHQDTVFLHFSTRLSFWPWLHPVTIKPWEVQAARTILDPNSSTTKGLYNEYQAVRTRRKG